MIMKSKADDSSFEKEVIEKSYDMPVLVDFWAPWCGPCLMLGPVIEKSLDTDDLRENVLLVKVDTTHAQRKSSEYNIMSIPNIKLFKNGKVIAETVGFRPLEQIRSWIRDNI